MKLTRASVLNLTVFGDAGAATVTAHIHGRYANGRPLRKAVSVLCNGLASPGNTAAIQNFPACEIDQVMVTADQVKGLAYAVVYLQIGSPPTSLVLCSGYPSNISISYPPNLVQEHVNQYGHSRAINNPAGSANLAYAIPLGEQWEDWTLQFTLVTSATVANRRVILTLVDPLDGELYRAVAPADQAASTTNRYVFGNFGQSSTQLASPNTVQMIQVPNLPLGANVSLQAARTIGTSILNLTAGAPHDQISAIALCGIRKITGGV